MSGAPEPTTTTPSELAESRQIQQLQLRALIAAMPVLGSSNLEEHAAPLADLINLRSASEPDAFTLRSALFLAYHRASISPPWAASCARLLNQLCILVDRTISDEGTPGVSGAALILKLVHRQLFKDIENKETRSAGGVALLGEFYLLPATSVLCVRSQTVFVAAKTIINGEREEDGGDVEVLVMLMESVKDKMEEDTAATEWLLELRQDLMILAADFVVPVTATMQILELLGSWRRSRF